jgi:hypothetical protein
MPSDAARASLWWTVLFAEAAISGGKLILTIQESQQLGRLKRLVMNIGFHQSTEDVYA